MNEKSRAVEEIDKLLDLFSLQEACWDSSPGDERRKIIQSGFTNGLVPNETCLGIINDLGAQQADETTKKVIQELLFKLRYRTRNSPIRSKTIYRSGTVGTVGRDSQYFTDRDCLIKSTKQRIVEFSVCCDNYVHGIKSK